MSACPSSSISESKYEPPARTATRSLAFVGTLSLALISPAPAEAEETSPKSAVSEVELRSWQPWRPVPYGYHAVRKSALGIIGTSLFGGGYALSGLTGLGLLASCSVTSSGTCYSSISNTSAAWLLVPIAGPFVALTRPDVQKEGGTVFWLSTFGAMQVVGAGLLTYYWTNPKYGLEQDESAQVSLLPVVSSHTQGLWVSACF